MHFEAWIEHDDSLEDRDKLLGLSDTIFEFIHEGCKDLELHDPHVTANLSVDEPDWATDARTTDPDR